MPQYSDKDIERQKRRRRGIAKLGKKVAERRKGPATPAPRAGSTSTQLAGPGGPTAARVDAVTEGSVPTGTRQSVVGGSVRVGPQGAVPHVANPATIQGDKIVVRAAGPVTHQQQPGVVAAAPAAQGATVTAANPQAQGVPVPVSPQEAAAAGMKHQVKVVGEVRQPEKAEEEAEEPAAEPAPAPSAAMATEPEATEAADEGDPAGAA